MDNRKIAEQLIDKYLAGKCTEEERALVERFYLQFFEDETFPVLSGRDIKGELSARLFPDIRYKPRPKPKNKISTLLRYAAAAAILAIVSVFGIYKRHESLKGEIASEKIVPGGNRATLTLGDGRKVLLNQAINGELAIESGTFVSKAGNGVLIYAAGERTRGNEKKPLYNKVETPAGGQYGVILPDGTKVWLNSSSSLSYPVVFKENRSVRLTGEGYFEVAHDKLHPFIVQSSGQSVQVLGTHFNVNTYQDEPAVQTTLLEGSIKIVTQAGKRILKPGEQATVRDKSLQVRKIDTEQVIAWKNGDFVFENTPLSVIMRQISRWYDVKIEYKGYVGGVRLGGSISRSKSLKEVLAVMELTQAVHFKVDGRSVTVMP